MRHLFHLVQIVFFHTVRPLIGSLPNRRVRQLAGLIGACLYYLKRGRRQRAIIELELLSGQKCSDYPSIVMDGFKLFVYNNFLSYCYHRMNPETIDEWIDLVNPEPIHAALSRGRGAIVILMHFGANQMAMPALGHRHYRINQIGSRPEDWHRLTGIRPSLLEARLADLRFRSERHLPAHFIYIDRSMLPVWKHLRRNEIVLMAADGRAGLKFFEVPFRNRIMSISQGPFRLAASTRCALIPAFCVFDPGTLRYRFEIESEIDPGNTDEEEGSLQMMADRFAERVSRRVERHPDHYCMLMSEARLRARHDATPLFKDHESLRSGGANV